MTTPRLTAAQRWVLRIMSVYEKSYLEKRAGSTGYVVIDTDNWVRLAPRADTIAALQRAGMIDADLKLTAAGRAEGER